MRASSLRGHVAMGVSLEVALSRARGSVGMVLCPVFFDELPRSKDARLPAQLGLARGTFARRLTNKKANKKANKINDIYTTFFCGISFLQVNLFIFQ